MLVQEMIQPLPRVSLACVYHIGAIISAIIGAMSRRWAFALIFAGILVTRLSHLGIVWVEEGYPTAAARQLLDGRVLYRDIWFDKPPLFPYIYTLWGAHTGLLLRLAGVGFVFTSCLLIYRFAADLWTEREGLAAASFLAFYLTFGIPAAVMALAPDLLMIAPHIAAVWLAWRARPLLAGLAAGVGLLLNAKAVFVLAACLLFTGSGWPWLLIGFVLPNLGALAIFGQPYLDQVWAWGRVYSAHGFAPREGIVRTGNWLGFQSALIVGVASFFRTSFFRASKTRWKMAAWILICLIAVASGWRFFPRYYFQLLVPITLLAARGFVFSGPRVRIAMAALMLIPLVRFGPRYVILANDLAHQRPHIWTDLQLSQDSERAAKLLTDRSGTLLVWGYRPDIFALTRMRAGARYLDSQPLTGVMADRHLTSSEVTFPELAAQNRQELIHTQPTYIVDGLGIFNPSLAITRYADLQPWLASYREIGRTAFSVVYQRSSTPAAFPKTR